MQPDSADNPFAAPQTSDVSIEQAERGVRMVIRQFRVIGWAEAVLAAVALTSVLILVVGSFISEDVAAEVGVAPAFAFVSCVAALTSLVLLSTAKRMKRRDPTVRRRAVILCCISVIGVLSLPKLRHYKAYCNAEDDDSV